MYGKRAILYRIFSLVYCALPILLGILDILSRIKVNDIVGVLDIYPYMSAVYGSVTGIVVILNIMFLIPKDWLPH